MSIQIDDLIQTIIDHGVRVSVYKRDDKVVFDLNTEAKSHLHLVNDGNKWYAETRYNNPSEIFDFNSVLCEVYGCMYGRPYISDTWRRILAEYEFDIEGQIEENTQRMGKWSRY